MHRTTRGEANRRAFSVLFFLFLFLLAGYSFLHSPFFEITRVTVSGNKYFTADEIRDLAGIQLGTSLFALDQETVAAALKRQPRIAAVRVEKKYPHEVRLRLKEREPVAILAYAGSFLELDAEGYLLGVVERAQVEFPVLTGVEPRYARVGGRLVSRPLLVGTRVAASLGDLAAQIAEINVAHPEAVLLYTNTAIQVLLGEPEKLPEKMGILRSLLATINREKLTVRQIDLRSLRNPVVK